MFKLGGKYFVAHNYSCLPLDCTEPLSINLEQCNSVLLNISDCFRLLHDNMHFPLHSHICILDEVEKDTTRQ